MGHGVTDLRNMKGNTVLNDTGYTNRVILVM